MTQRVSRSLPAADRVSSFFLMPLCHWRVQTLAGREPIAADDGIPGRSRWVNGLGIGVNDILRRFRRPRPFWFEGHVDHSACCTQNQKGVNHLVCPMPAEATKFLLGIAQQVRDFGQHLCRRHSSRRVCSVPMKDRAGRLSDTIQKPLPSSAPRRILPRSTSQACPQIPDLAAPRPSGTI